MWQPKNWWQASLAFGSAITLLYVVRQAMGGSLTLHLVIKDVIVWELAGLMFGLALTAVLSMLAGKNLFRGFPDAGGPR